MYIYPKLIPNIAKYLPMTAWRLHLTNQAIQQVDLLPGESWDVLAVWLRRDRVAFHDAEGGAMLEDRAISVVRAENRRAEIWQEFVSGLVAPNGAYLPLVHTPQVSIRSTEDGKMRLYHAGDTDLFLETEGKEVPLEVKDASAFVGLDFDRLLGNIVALDEHGKLHVYQQNIRIGAFDIGLTVHDELQPSVAIAQGGSVIFACDGERLVQTDTSGRVRKQLLPHYMMGRIACSPNGRWVTSNDLETGVIRVYSGTDLSLLYQRFAIDLLAAAVQVQLLADLPPVTVAPSALTIGDNGMLAFALAGVICVTDTSRMDELPRAKRLL